MMEVKDQLGRENRAYEPFADMLEQPTFSQIELEKIRIAAQVVIDRQLMGAKVQWLEHHLTDQLVIQIQGYLLGETKEPEPIVYPKTWWDALKIRWFPKWLLKRYPAERVRHDIKFNIMYPNFRVRLPTEDHIVRIAHSQYNDWLPTRCEG